MPISVQDVPLSIKERVSDLFTYTPLAWLWMLPLLPLVVVVGLLFMLLMYLWMGWEMLREKYGPPRRRDEKTKLSLPESLPAGIRFERLLWNEASVAELSARLGFAAKDIYEMDLGHFTAPGLTDRIFDGAFASFQNKVIALEALPAHRTALVCIDGENMLAETLCTLDIYPLISFRKQAELLEATLRAKGMKKIVSVSHP